MLIHSLAKIAAKELKNTGGVHPQFKKRIELLAVAYGAAAVEKDFEAFCQSLKGSRVPYPISEYLKAVDVRLGTTGPEAIEENDPAVAEISAKCFTLSGRLPKNSAVGALLKKHSAAEIIIAFESYCAKLDEDELRYAVKSFFTDGGATGVIVSLKQQKEQSEKDTAEEVARQKRHAAAIEADNKRHKETFGGLLTAKPEEKSAGAADDYLAGLNENKN